MASLADSKAHFLARAKEYSVPDDLVDNMKVAGISTMAHLAFAFVRPGQDFEEEKFDRWAKEVNLGVAPTLGALAALRRSHFEAEIILTATLKSSAEPSPRCQHAETTAVRRENCQVESSSWCSWHRGTLVSLTDCRWWFDSPLVRE